MNSLVNSAVNRRAIHPISEQVNSFSTQLRKTSNLLFYIDIGVNSGAHNPNIEKLGKPVHLFTPAKATP